MVVDDCWDRCSGSSYRTNSSPILVREMNRYDFGYEGSAKAGLVICENHYCFL